MDLEKLIGVVGQKVFVVFIVRGTRTTDFGTLQMRNDDNAIVIDNGHVYHKIKYEDETCKILKVYDEQGYVVYDNEPVEEKSE